MMFLLLVVITLILVVGGPKPKVPTNLTDYISDVCPPHKWKYVEIKDKDGNMARWKLVCERCGPIRPSDGPAGMR